MVGYEVEDRGLSDFWEWYWEFQIFEGGNNSVDVDRAEPVVGTRGAFFVHCSRRVRTDLGVVLVGFGIVVFFKV